MKSFFYISLICLLSLPALARQEAVGVRKVGIRPKPSILSKPTEFFQYGDLLEVIEEKKSWVQVKGKKKNGWLRKSSLGKKKSILKDLGKGELAAKKAYRDEVASAAKGFSKEFEELSSKKNGKLDFKSVDQIESFTTNYDLTSFSQSGTLSSALFETTVDAKEKK